jgi:hypothetical protein
MKIPSVKAAAKYTNKSAIIKPIGIAVTVAVGIHTVKVIITWPPRRNLDGYDNTIEIKSAMKRTN